MHLRADIRHLTSFDGSLTVILSATNPRAASAQAEGHWALPVVEST